MTSVICNKISKQRTESADELAQMLRSLWLVGEVERREERERGRFSDFSFALVFICVALRITVARATTASNFAHREFPSQTAISLSSSMRKIGKGKATSRWQTVTSTGKSPWSQASTAKLLPFISLPFHAMLPLGLGKQTFKTSGTTHLHKRRFTGTAVPVQTVVSG